MQPTKKVLLDENLPHPMANLFKAPLEVISVHDIGWAEKKNGDLIRSMLEEGFEILLTADKNLQHQQNLTKYPIRVALLRLYDNRLKSLTKHIELIQTTILAAADNERIIEIDLRNLG